MGNLAKDRGWRTAFVTGASTGLGRAFATMLRADGLEVWVTSRNAARAPAGEGLHPLALDLHDPEAWRAAVTQVKREAGVPDVLVNNAGAGVLAAFARFPEAEIGLQLRLMLEGPMLLTRAFWPEMLERGRGAVVNVSSLAAEFPLPCLSVYTAAKGGLSAFTRTLMMEAEGRGVQVVDLQPGDYQTDFNRGMQIPPGAATWETRLAEKYDEILKASPLPAQAAEDLRRALAGGRSGTVATGMFTQTHLAGWAQRIFGHRLTRQGLRHYFGLGHKK